MSKEELFLQVSKEYIDAVYDPAQDLRVLKCTPMDREVMVNDVYKFKDLGVEIQEALVEGSVDGFIQRYFMWKGVKFFAYYQD